MKAKLILHKIILLFLMVPFLLSCSRKTYMVREDSVTIQLHEQKPGNPGTIRIQVISDKIIRVSASEKKTVPETGSLMVVNDRKPFTQFKCEEKDSILYILTKNLKVEVSLLSGRIIFYDSADRVILMEKEGGGKTIATKKVGKEQLLSIRQEFGTNTHEGLYGLGENQTSFLNLKGKDADLFQVNTVAVVPFLVSSNNYGILWDNNSRTLFGDVREFENLEGLRFFDKEGKEGGLTATYRLKDDTTKVIVSRLEKELSYQFLEDQKKFPAGYKLGAGLVTWEGFIEPESSGMQKFLFTSAGYSKIWIDGKQLYDLWRQCWNPVTKRFTLPMEKGKKYAIRLEWKPDGDESYLALRHLNPLSQDQQENISLYSESADILDYYFIYGSTMDEVISGYRQLTGKAPIMPEWAMGFWQSRERYKTQDEILTTVREFRRRGIPLDNIVLDWFYWKEDKWGDHEFDSSRFPDPEKMIHTLHDSLNTRFMISTWPKFYVGTENYKAMDEKGWLYKKNIDDNQKDWVGYVSTFYDAFNKDARKYYWDQLNKKLFSKGVDAWWLDATEPDVLSNVTMDHRKAFMNPTALGPASKYFNAYPLVHAGGVYEGQRSERPNQRVFILTRSAFAGMQRYAAATWSGDIAARWHDMKDQIPAGLNFSVSGIPYWTMDIGGFAVENRFMNASGETMEEWREQMTRWFQFGAFCPLFRAHGQYPLREIFNVAPEDHPAYQAMLNADRLRYLLMPYLYSLAGATYLDDYTIMRPLVMDFPADPSVTDLKDQFMLGPQLLVNPVCEYKARSRKVYLPSGQGWYDLYSGKSSDGGITVEAGAPLGHIPVFVRSGSILPLGPEIQYTGEKRYAPINLCIFSGSNGTFTLYEDEGINYNYEKGEYTRIKITYDGSRQELILGDREGNFKGMQVKRLFNIILVDRNHTFDPFRLPSPLTTVDYSGKALTIRLNK